MSFSDLRYALERTYDDRQISRSERQAFSQLLMSEAIRPEHVHRLRSHAFDMVKRPKNQTNHALDLEWLEETMRLLHHALETTQTPMSRAFFSPGTDCLTQVLNHCDQAGKSLDICMYTITDNRIKNALLRAHNRNIRIRIVTEDEKIDARGSDIRDLKDAGIRIAIDDHPAYMHHKFAIMDGTVLLNGSFNWTRGATNDNWENLVVSHDKQLIAQFAERFQEYWDTLPRF